MHCVVSRRDERLRCSDEGTDPPGCPSCMQAGCSVDVRLTDFTLCEHHFVFCGDAELINYETSYPDTTHTTACDTPSISPTLRSNRVNISTRTPDQRTVTASSNSIESVQLKVTASSRVARRRSLHLRSGTCSRRRPSLRCGLLGGSERRCPSGALQLRRLDPSSACTTRSCGSTSSCASK